MNERLALLRAELGLSMDKFGSKIGVSRSAISKFESGISGISEQTILSICREFHVNYLWLTEGIGEMFTGTPETLIDELTEEYDLDDMDKKIIEMYLALSKEQRQAIKIYFKSIFT